MVTRPIAGWYSSGVSERRNWLSRLLTWLMASYLLASLAAFIVALGRLLRWCLRRPSREGGRPVDSHVVPDWAFRQPDPLIYSQPWLQARGLAVTWQNPDIHLELPTAPGTAVDSWSLAADTVYRVFARVWNGSVDAPVGDLPVEFSYLDFGIGGTSVPIDTTTVDLPVKGASGTPAAASVSWRTPATAGHYCVQVRLVWPFDADPGNNMGQHNVVVRSLNSPTATFVVPVRNHERRPLTMRLVTDGYRLPALEPCPPERRPERDERRIRAVHAIGAQPIPEGWSVDLGDAADGVRLRPGESVDVSVTLTAPDGFVGQQAINLNGFAGERLVGGVTLIAEGEADA